MGPSRTTRRITSRKFITQINQITSQVRAISGCRNPRRLVNRTRSSAAGTDRLERRVCSWDRRQRPAPTSSREKGQSPAVPTQGRVRNYRKPHTSNWQGQGRELRPSICTWARCRVENSEIWATATTVLRPSPHCRVPAYFITRHRHRTSTGSTNGDTADEATVDRAVKINTAFNSSRFRTDNISEHIFEVHAGLAKFVYRQKKWNFTKVLFLPKPTEI